jgi:signal transduction histidine kinase
VHAGEIDLRLEGTQPLRAAIDSGMFRQVLDNIVDNAIRYRREKPARLTLRVRQTLEGVELRAADEGIGIPTDHLRDVFRRFYRVGGHGAPRSRTGTGIGLFVVQSIVSGHGGRVGAESDGVGGGTTIWIRLPAADAAEAETAA